MRIPPPLQILTAVLALALIPVLRPAAAEPMAPEFVTVFSAGDAGYGSIRIPAVVLSRRGVLLAFAEGRATPADQAGNDLILRRSLDQGRTWGPIQIVQEDGAHSLNNPTVVTDDHTGRTFLIYQRIPSHLKERSAHIATGHEGPDIYRCLVTWSDDDGQTWTAPRDITRSAKREAQATTIASGPGIGIQLRHGPHAGRLIIPFNAGPYHLWNNYAVFSDDHGATWVAGDNVPGAFLPGPSGERRSQINEVQMAELGDGSVRLNSRPFAGHPVRKTSVSADGGRTWSPVTDVPEQPDPSCNASILRHTPPANGQPGLLLFSGPHGTRRSRGTVHLSRDDGATWPVQRRFWEGFFAYSVLVRLPDGTVGCLFEADDYHRLVFARIPLDWITSDDP
ncbi:MAG: exo-alpha-sialidase [Verrucomicrobia bacterium]|nr:exo-alpha-sialidase [Verrucomicrobiota bacterium]